REIELTGAGPCDFPADDAHNRAGSRGARGEVGGVDHAHLARAVWSERRVDAVSVERHIKLIRAGVQFDIESRRGRKGFRKRGPNRSRRSAIEVHGGEEKTAAGGDISGAGRPVDGDRMGRKIREIVREIVPSYARVDRAEHARANSA